MTRWGVLLPTFDPLRLGAPVRVTEAARLAEELGFDSVWAGDHLACPAPTLDAPACLAAAAAVTTRVGLGLSVMLLGLRPVAWAAKQLATVQAVSGGRLRLGVGVGGEFPDEFSAAGVPVRERGARLDAALSVLPELLAGRPVTSSVEIPALEPAVPIPPLLVGGRSDAAIRRAARFGDFWLPMWLSPHSLSERAGVLADAAASLGRPRPGLAMLIGVRVDEDRDRAWREADEHARGQYRLGLERIEHWTGLGSAPAVAEFLHPYLDVGVEELILMPLGSEPLEQIERLATVVGDLRDVAGEQLAKPA